MPTPPYDTLDTVIQAARVRVNDAIASIGGEILKDTAPFTPGVVNNSWRRLQEYLADRGYAALNRETIFSNVAAWGATDPGTFAYIDWTGYWDGAGQHATPALPQDMIQPLDLFERVHGSSAIFTPMDPVFSGLPTANPSGSTLTPRDVLNRLWESRQEKVYLPGASGATDIRLRYAGYIADFLIGPQDTLSAGINNSVTTLPLTSGATINNGNVGSGAVLQIDSEILLSTAGGGTNSQTVTRGYLGTTAAAHSSGAPVYVLTNGIPVTIMRSLNSFAWYMCSEVARPRGDLDAGQFDQLAMQSAEQVWNRDYRQGKQLYQRAELGKVPDENSRLSGANAPAGKGGNA